MKSKDVREEEITVRWITALLETPYSLGAVASGVFLFLLYVAIAELSYFFVIPPSFNAIFWLPSGISFSMFLRARWLPKIWPYWLAPLFLAQLFIVVIHDVPPITAVLWSLANIILPLTAVFLARRFVWSPFDFSRIRDVLSFMLLVTVSVIPGSIVAAIGTRAGLLSESLVSSAVSWAASDALGIVLIAPVILSWTTRAPWPAGSFAEATILFGMLTATSFVVFEYAKRTTLDRSLLTFLFFFLAWAAIRFGPRGTSLALVTIDLIQVWATYLGLGPFASPELTEADQILNLQILVTNIGLLMLLLAAAIEEQRTARMTAETALKTRDEFLSIASHELRTPLTTLAMQVQMIHRLARDGRLAGLSTEKLAYLSKVSERQLIKFSSLINDLLDVSRIGAGRLTLHLEDVDLPQTVQGVSSRFRVEAESSHSPIELHGDSHIIGHWDRIRVEQIIAKLLSNALKYGAGHPIEITTEQNGDTARLTFRDHGIGISKDNQARIFERFERAASIKQFGGLGLGLFVVGRIVEAHGGVIHVDSEVGQGSSFSVELPLHKPSA